MPRRLAVTIAACVAALAVTAPAATAAPKAKRISAKAAVAACPAADDAPTSGSTTEAERTVLCLVNLERTRRGLDRLRSNGRLADAAVRHSRDMVRRRYFSHVSPGGGTMGERIRETGYLRSARGYSLGENLAWGTGELATPLKIVEAWMKSPGHKANILHRSFDELGVGLVLGAPGRDGGATYTTNFGRRG
jgi:uncharacterized protein YkwD